MSLGYRGRGRCLDACTDSDLSSRRSLRTPDFHHVNVDLTQYDKPIRGRQSRFSVPRSSRRTVDPQGHESGRWSRCGLPRAMVIVYRVVDKTLDSLARVGTRVSGDGT